MWHSRLKNLPKSTPMGSSYMKSRKANAVGGQAAVACDQPAAALIGMKIVEQGGAAADAAVAMAAAISVLQPSTCGLGGDAWILYYDKSTEKVTCIDGSGTTAADFTPEKVKAMGFHETSPPPAHPICVTVPGAPAAWCDLHEKFGSHKFSLTDLLYPAIDLAESGFPVSETSAYLWRTGWLDLTYLQKYPFPKEFLYPGTDLPPKAGQIMRLPDMARSYRELGQQGKKGFYEGRIANAIVDCVQSKGGLLTLEDLASYEPLITEPLKVSYKSQSLGRQFKVWETPMNSQAIVTLEALKILEATGIDLAALKNADYYHAILESLKFGFKDLAELWRLAENGLPPNSYTKLLEPENILKRSSQFNKNQAIHFQDSNIGCEVVPKGDTSYFCVTDKAGNACSQVCSTYNYFGTPWVPENCGFTLHDRGFHFWEFMHKKFAPNVRPFHTLCAGMVTDEENQFLSAFGCMGGQNQPQGHLQVLLNMLELDMSPQDSLDRPRVMTEFDYFTGASGVFVEDSSEAELLAGALAAKGRSIQQIVKNYERNKFGRGHIITKGAWWDVTGRFGREDGVLWAASDPRSDGVALVI